MDCDDGGLGLRVSERKEGKPAYIAVGEPRRFRTIADACNYVFESGYKMVQKSCFTPLALRERYGDKYIAWFFAEPQSGMPNKAGFMNVISADGTEIREHNVNDDVIYETWRDQLDEQFRNGVWRIVFAKQGGSGYRFVGVFELAEILKKEGKYSSLAYRRVDDRFPILGAAGSAVPSQDRPKPRSAPVAQRPLPQDHPESIVTKLSVPSGEQCRKELELSKGFGDPMKRKELQKHLKEVQKLIDSVGDFE